MILWNKKMTTLATWSFYLNGPFTFMKYPFFVICANFVLNLFSFNEKSKDTELIRCKWLQGSNIG